MKKGFQKIIASRFWFLWLMLLLAGINYLASDFHTRLDLTKEKRYTLSKSTNTLLQNLDDEVFIEVFLKGEFPSGFQKLANSTTDFLRLLKDRTGKIHYRFIAPTDGIEGTQTTYGDSLVALGAVPINLTVQKKTGESSNIIFPVAIMRYKGKQALVNLYPGASGRISQEEINSAEALMEYQFAKTLDKLTQTEKKSIGYSIGNGEPTDARTFDLVKTLEQDYEFKTIDLNVHSRIPPEVDLLIIVKPTKAFNEAEKLKIDQFVMQGGKALFFIDNLIAEQDSLSFKPETIAFDRDLNLTDMFFRYGLRVNTDLVMDLQCDQIPIVVGGTMENPQLEYLHWNYFPLLIPADNQVSKGLGYVSSRFANSIDTIQVAGIRKQTLLVSSPNSRTISTPALISLNENRNVPEDEKFRKNAIPVGLLLEGKFTSIFRNNLSSAQRDSLASAGMTFRETSVETKIVVVADGDIVLNDLLPGSGPIPMGWNKYTYTEYLQESEAGKLFVPVANRDFLLNNVEYLVNNPAISETKNKDIVLRLLDSRKVADQKGMWQFLNIALPILLVMLAGWIYQQIRKRKYAS